MKRKADMKISRRGFIGGAAAAAPAIATATPEKLAGLMDGLGGGGYYGKPLANAATGGGAYGRMMDFIHATGELPEWLLDDMRRDANYHISALDPDLAVGRSQSLAFKVAVQKQRNFERAIERWKKDRTMMLQREAMIKAFKND